MANEKKSSKNLIITILVVGVVGLGAFFAGMLFQKSQTQTSYSQYQGMRRFGQNTMMGRQNGNRGFGGAVVGEIESIDNDSLTIKLPDGSSKIVNLSNSTTYSKTDNGSKTDLKAGMRVAAIGATNSDGSVTAQNIQINPMFRMNRLSPTPGK